jgi:short-chain fatty acids transporter
MLARAGVRLSRKLQRHVPDPFVFALALTVIVGGLAVLIGRATPVSVIDSWYRGFWILLEFGMQAVLMLTTGYAIALSPIVRRFVDWFSRRARGPAAVYALVVFVGGLFSLVSWGWGVLTAVLARELSRGVRGVDYGYLTACAYLAGSLWVCGLSSSIPLLLNTEGNFLIETGVLPGTIAVRDTLGSTMNLMYMTCYLLFFPLLMVLLRPHPADSREVGELLDSDIPTQRSVVEEAASLSMPDNPPSDRANNSSWLQIAIVLCGFWYLGRYFVERGLDLNLNVMIFVFVMTGMLVHRTPIHYVVAMRQACSNVSGIIFQYPFYAGIMGIMMFTDLGETLSSWMAARATVATLPVIAQLSGALMNLAIPSAGGEWAVVGPSIMQAAQTLAADLPQSQAGSFLARIAMAVAYGETTTNLLQPFFLLIILPVMGAGVRIQARDVMGYLLIPFAVSTLLTAAFVTWAPI